jgi:hypothetical protein
LPRSEVRCRRVVMSNWLLKPLLLMADIPPP